MKKLHEVEFDNTSVQAKIIGIAQVKDIKGVVNNKNLFNVKISGVLGDDQFSGYSLLNTNNASDEFLTNLTKAAKEQGTLTVSLSSRVSTSDAERITTFINEPETFDDLDTLDLTATRTE